MAVCIVWGTRPEHIKIFPVWKALQELEVPTYTVFTGQHHELVDHEHLAIKMNKQLNVMHTGQSLQMLLVNLLTHLPEMLLPSPSLIVVQGDTSSALAGAVSSFYTKIPLAHIEAGLSTWDSFDPFPEEMHRRLIRELSKYHFAPTSTAAKNLRKVGVKQNIYITGNTVVDSLKALGYSVSQKRSHAPVILVTIHRRENDEYLEEICLGLSRLAHKETKFRFKFIAHPRNEERIRFYLKQLRADVEVKSAMDYLSFLEEFSHSWAIITDSGGIQEEATVLGVPCFVVRKKTERTEAIDKGLSVLVGVTANEITSINLKESKSVCSDIYGDGQAGMRIAKVIKSVI